jgi:putative ABC transport system substrate-binding protein
VALRPDVILVQTTPLVAAVQQESRTVPIIFFGVSDPVGSGFITSLARPGGNATGFLLYENGIVGKWMTLLKEIAPGLTRVALLADPKTTPYDYFLRNAEAAAPPLALELVPSPVDSVDDIERSIELFARLADGGLLVVTGSLTTLHRGLIIALAARYRLPAVYPWRYCVTDGGLMSYSVDVADVSQQAASYADRILRGEKVADLPVQAPTRYETVINLKTAKSMGLEVPSSLLVRADQVLE